MSEKTIIRNVTDSSPDVVLSTTEQPKQLVDLRKAKNRLWSSSEPDSKNLPDEPVGDINKYIYEGYKKGGQEFLKSVIGRFGIAYHDEKDGVIFLCRDWIGEIPLHYYLTDQSIVVANYISDIQAYLGAEQWQYDFVRVVAQSQALVFDTKDEYIFGTHTRNIWTILERSVYYNFLQDSILGLTDHPDQMRVKSPGRIQSMLEESVQRRLSAYRNGEPLAVLLSGGIDSLTVAYFLSKMAPQTIAYTLSIGDGGHDVSRAREIAGQFNLEFRAVKVSPDSLTDNYTEAVRVSELYHLPNVYCALGMIMLGKALKADGIKAAFCGEGVNEALGDYHDWVVRDPITRTKRILQRIDERQMSKTIGRIRYVWGRTRQEGRFNLQLGSGLAKHGVGRMVKPLLKFGIELECPYFDHNLMSCLVSISQSYLDEIGGKPGLLAKAFEDKIKKGEIPKHFFLDSQKIRLQDASEFGDGGITPNLLAGGFDQEKTIHIFNDLFGSHLSPKFDANRLSLCTD